VLARFFLEYLPTAAQGRLERKAVRGAGTRLRSLVNQRRFDFSIVFNTMSVPNISGDLQNMDIGGGVKPSPFPASTKHAAGLVNGQETDVSSIYFSDKIMITISQAGRLSQWVGVSLFYNGIRADSMLYRYKYLCPQLLQPLSIQPFHQMVKIRFRSAT